MKNSVVAIDFGTSKIVTLVAETSGMQRCDIIGAGIAQYDGYLQDGWNNPGELDEAIRRSIADAESQSKRKVREINIGVPGAFTKVYATQGQIAISGTDPRVMPGHVQQVFKQAGENLGQFPGQVVHSSPAWFMVDQGKKTLEPVNNKGASLQGMISFVVANQFFVDDMMLRFEAMGIKVNGFYSSVAGESMLYLPEEDRDHTSVLIDIGYLNTDLSVVEGDAVIYHDVIDIGGGNLAADLAMGLDIPLSSAEQIKRQYTYSLTSTDKTYEVPGMDGQKPMSFEREKVGEILEARVDELAELILHSIEDSGTKLGNWSNVYLTGGGLSMNRGGRDYLAGKLGRPVRETPKRTTKLNSHVFSSALGLMDLIIDTMENQHANQAGPGSGVKSFFRDLLGI